MDLSIRGTDESTIRFLDGLAVFWFVLWLVVGTWTGYTLWQFSELGDTVTASGEALGSAGRALEAVGAVPVVGERPGELGLEIVSTSEQITDRGQEVKSQLHQLSLLLGLAIVVMPTTPVLGLYLPLRLARRRDLAALRRSLSRATDGQVLDRYLAERALRALPFATVTALVDDPWAAIDEGRARPLADAELHRLGLRRPGS